jgi:DNA (cytosine-5)-methyltransferase 1
MISVGSLFSGIGGWECGLEATGGFETRWFVEKDPYARQILARHWPTVPCYEDVCTFPPSDCLESEFQVDCLTAGWPCQDASNAGRVDLGLQQGLDGERTGLFSEVIRVAGWLRPRYLLLENVPALLVHGRGFGRVLGQLADLGFAVEWQVIPAAALGLGHTRSRLILVAYPDDEGLEGHRIFNEHARQRFARSRLQETHGKESAPDLERIPDGLQVANRVDRIKRVGASIAPPLAELIGNLVLEKEANDARVDP